MGLQVTAFLLTQLLEMPLYVLALSGRPAWQRLAIAFGTSTLTHPLV